MRTYTFFLILTLYAGLSLPVQAVPVMVPALRSTANTYSIFFINPKQLSGNTSVAQAQIALTNQLAALTPPLKSCFTDIDFNGTNIRCGTGNAQMQLGISEFFGYNRETLLQGLPSNTLDKSVHKVWASNFLTPPITQPPTPTENGRVARIHFTGRMAQFGMLVDPGRAGAPQLNTVLLGSLNTIQFIVNGQALPPKPITAGVVQFIGVEDTHGFTDITVIAAGVTRAFVADKLAFVPLANF